ncbi:protein zinc induced facilitator-LIKE 1 [Naviculisporaceae sp. PSN 640]
MASPVKQSPREVHKSNGGNQDVTETTPLLATTAGEEALAPALRSEAEAEISEANTLSPSDYDESEDKPLPLTQIFFLCYVRWVEPVAFFSIVPYVNQMAQENGNLAEADVGFYSGLIESLFSLTQMMVMIHWGKASDRFGRKPVLVCSLIGVTCATALFGMAKTIWEMILFRCLAGVFAGTIVTIRTMFSEHSTFKTQARAFSYFSFVGNMGILFGPVIGGLLAEPAAQYPKLFGNIQFFIDYPYALPSFAVGCIGLSAIVVAILFVEETLPRGLLSKSRSSSVVASSTTTTDYAGSEAGSETSEAATVIITKPIPTTTWQLLTSPGVGTVLYTQGHVMLLAFAYTAIAPLFMYTPIELGGFAFTSPQIAFFIGLNGLAQVIWTLVVFPPLQSRIGTNGVIRLCAAAYPVWFLMQPLFNLLLREDDQTLTTIFWVLAPTGIFLGCGVCMSFTAMQLALNDVSPSPLVYGTLNSIALSIISGVRAFSPALFTALFAVSAKAQDFLWGYSIWLLLVFLAFGFTVVSWYLPDGEKMRREREERDNAAR